MTDELIDRYVSGEASREDCQQLRTAIDADPQLIGRLYLAAERECELFDLFAKVPQLALAQTPPPTTSEGELRPTARIARRRAAMSWRRWLPIAAAMLVAGFAWALIHRLHDGAHARDLVALNEPHHSSTNPGAPEIATQPKSHAPVVPASTPIPEQVPAPVNVDLTVHNVSTPVSTEAPIVTQLGDPVTSQTPTLAMAPKPETQTPSRPQATAAQIDSRDGEIFDDAGQAVMRYTLRAPHAPSSDARLGLALCFHGAGGDERWLADPMTEALRASGAANEFVVASLKSHGKNWMPEDDPRVMAFIDWARRTYPIDVRRVIVQGVSNGGWFVNYFSSRHLDLVAGVVTLCNGAGFDLKKVANASETAPEFYLVHGTDDKDVNVKNSRNAVGMLRSLGYRFVYREYPGVAHNVYDDERTRRDFAAWVERLRHKTMPLGEEDRKALMLYSKSDDADRLIQTPAGAATLLRIGGVPAERILVRSLHAHLPAVRACAAELLARTVCSPGISALLIQSLDDKDDSVHQAALGTLTSIADWHDQEALVALCLCAGTKSHAHDERLGIVDHLVRSLAFRCSPCPDNQLIYELLVHLLEDEDQELRSAGLTALMGSAAKPPSQFGYRPEAAAAARREPVAHWKSWYLDTFAAPVEKK